MQYRTFGPLDWQVSVLGFGAMRLPIIDDDFGQIEEAEATRMLRYAIDHGVNYVDTAYPYHRGASEAFVGRALQDGYRERVRLATKMPTWLIEKTEDSDRYLAEQLERLQTEYIDFYLLHGLNAENWPKIRDLGVLDWAEGAMADGRFRHLGFSFHADYEVFQEIVDAYDNWTFFQIQYNYMDEEYQAGTRGLEYGVEKGLAAVIMEPIRGGQLSNNPPQVILDLWDTAPQKRSPAEWALQWVWNHPEVSVVLSGMSKMEHVEENIVSAGRSRAGLLNADELALIARVRDQYRELSPIPCTDCGYCQPCPEGVYIPRIFETYNEGVMYNQPERVKGWYNSDWWLKAEQRADRCVQCGECETKCPQDIAIIEWLEKVHEALGEGETD
jgi:predicted aldo/keto reductase-like oxidoreductase